VLEISSGGYTATWGAVPEADAYRLQSINQSQITVPLLDTVITGSSFRLDYATLDGNVQFRVNAIADQDTSGWSDWCMINYIWNTPVPVQPACGALNINHTDTLRWEGTPGNQTYNIQYSLRISETATPDVIAFGTSTGNQTYYIVPVGLKPLTEYQWQVQAIVFGPNSGKDSYFSEPCTFTTGPGTSVEEADTEDYKVISNSGMIEVRSDKMIESLSLIDLTGKQVAQSDNTIINTSNLSTGMYFLLIDEERFMKVMVD
jgi:hypothetical protein